MNINILNKEVQDFINANLKFDLSKLILKGSPFMNVTIQEVGNQINSKNKCEKKLPKWFSTENIYYPTKLNIEQTSSEATARYKSNLITGKSLIDITGGLGVDAYYFAQKFVEVTHCEINEELVEIVNHNLKQFKIKNIATFCDNGMDYLKNYDGKFDWIYADPSRRNDVKGKVFLLKDCSPNIPDNLELLFQKTNKILIKTSPLLDIKNAVNELKSVKEIHVIAIENEVKELLFLLQKNYTQKIEIQTINFTKTAHQQFKFILDKPAKATITEPKRYIYEPNAAILKSGAFNHISQQFKIDKLHQHSHSYTSDNLIDFPGRRFELKQCVSYNKKLLKKLLPSKKQTLLPVISLKQFLKFEKKQASKTVAITTCSLPPLYITNIWFYFVTRFKFSFL